MAGRVFIFLCYVCFHVLEMLLYWCVGRLIFVIVILFFS